MTRGICWCPRTWVLEANCYTVDAIGSPPKMILLQVQHGITLKAHGCFAVQMCSWRWKWKEQVKMNARCSWQVHVESKFFFPEFWIVKIAEERRLQDGCICRFWMDAIIFPYCLSDKIKVIYLLSTLYLPYLYQLVQLMQRKMSACTLRSLQPWKVHIPTVGSVSGHEVESWMIDWSQ